MKRFLLKLAFAALLAVLAAAASLARIGRAPADRSVGREVYLATDRARAAHPSFQRVLIGDSVGRQLFEEKYQRENGATYYLASNQAVTPMGNYLLLLEYLARNPQTREAVYVALPSSLCNDFGTRYTFHYFILPFVRTGMADALDPEDLEHLEAKFGRPVVRNARLQNALFHSTKAYEFYSDRLPLSSVPARIPGRIPDRCAKYLCRIRDLCASNGVALRIVCPPLRDDARTAPFFDQRELDRVGLGDVATNYFADAFRVPSSHFRDVHHFDFGWLAKNRRDLILRMSERTGTRLFLDPEAKEAFSFHDDAGQYFAETGFSAPSSRGRWSVGERSALRVGVPVALRGGAVRVRIEGAPFLCAAKPSQTVRFRCAGREVFARDYALGEPPGVVAFDLSAEETASGEIRIETEHPGAVSPQSVGFNGDRRELGFEFLTCRFEPAGAAGVP